MWFLKNLLWFVAKTDKNWKHSKDIKYTICYEP